MSAIAVIFRLNHAPVTHREVRAMLDRLEHRGTDGDGIFLDESIALGHRMRWTTPESLLEELPLSRTGGSRVITCDARIDNRSELVGHLFPQGTRESEVTDSEIILRSYEKWGEGCVERLLGDFVFAIWDAREQRLFCARDSMGVKHFYYHHRPGTLFAMASEIKALLGLPGVPRQLNEGYIGDLLILNLQDKEITPYQEVKRLPANCAMRVDKAGVKIWQYWRPAAKPGIRFRSSRDYEDEFREIFTEAVRCRLRSVRATGSLLSGGLDSSSISCIASRCLAETGKPPLETFSAVFPSIAAVDPRIDERKFIDSVARSIRCNANYVVADMASPFLDMDELQWHADHPIAAPNVFMDWALLKAGRDRNVGVLLSGFDGDSTVSYGYEAFSILARQGRWWALFRDAAALNKNIPAKRHSLKKLVWKDGFVEGAPDFLRQAWRIAHGRPRHLRKDLKLPGSMDFRHNSLNAGFALKQRLKDRYFETVTATHPDDVRPAEAHWNALCGGLFAFTLESFEKLAAAFQIEMRFPFFDRRLIEFCISLPASQRIYKGWTRSILRRAMNDILPSEVQWRTDKAIIGLSYKVNMLKYGQEEVEKALFRGANVLDAFIDRETLAAAYSRYRSDPIKHGREAMLIISTVYLANWLGRSFGTRAAYAQ